jgi:uncharacterized membrane protein
MRGGAERAPRQALLLFSGHAETTRAALLFDSVLTIFVKAFARFPEVDAARGLAVVAMLAFNWQYALGFYGLTSFNASSGLWFWFARLVGAAFLFIAGVSLWLALQRKSERQLFNHAAKIFGLGLVITLVTWLVIPREFVAFGILHCIGLSLALAIPLAKAKQVKPGTLALLGFGVVIAGVALSGPAFSFPWLLWLGFAPSGFASVDYFPLAPWFGVLLFGVAFAKKFYGCAKALQRSTVQQPNSAIKGLALIGRHSLAIYLLHQPALLAALLLGGFKVQGLNLFGLV